MIKNEEKIWRSPEEIYPDDYLDIVVSIEGYEFEAKKFGDMWWILGNPPHFRFDKWRYKRCVENVIS
jgi:hypothetical protein